MPTANTMTPPKTPTLTANFPEPECGVADVVVVAPRERVVSAFEPVAPVVGLVAVEALPVVVGFEEPV